MSMKRIIIHWSAGGYKASQVDKQHYHVMVEGDGTIVRGDNAIADNEIVNDGKYAAHTRGCNQGSIGISMCGMMNAEGPGKLGPYPLRKVQFDACMREVARLAKLYKIPVTRTTVLSHAEVQPTLGIEQRGKIDIAFGIPTQPDLRGPITCGDYMRGEVKRWM